MMDPITVCMGCCDKKYSEQYYAIVRNSMMNTKTVYMCFYTKLKKYSKRAFVIKSKGFDTCNPAYIRNLSTQ